MAKVAGQPSYLQLAAELQRRIETGEIPNGHPLPSAPELMSEFSVSSTVVKNGIAVLKSQGLVVGHQGKARFAQYPPLQPPPPWAVALAAAGREMNVVLRDVAAGEDVEAQRLDQVLQAWQDATANVPEHVRQLAEAL